MLIAADAAVPTELGPGGNPGSPNGPPPPPWCVCAGSSASRSTTIMSDGGGGSTLAPPLASSISTTRAMVGRAPGFSCAHHSPQRHVGQPPHARLVPRGRGEPPVQHLRHAPLPRPVGDQLREVGPPPGPAGPGLGLQVPPPAEHLHKHHPVAVHVGLLRDAGAQEPLRGQVPRGAAHRGHHPALLLPHQRGQPEVGEHPAEAVVEEDVLGLHVQVHHLGAAVVVQVRQRPGHVHGHLVPLQPRQAPPAGAAAVPRLREDPPVQRPVVHVLVHEEARAVADEAEAEQAHQAHVLHAADGRHLRPELLVHVRRPVDPLHRHGRAVVEDALEHRPRRPLPHHVLEAVRRRRQRLQREPSGQPGHLAEVAVLHARRRRHILAAVQHQPPRHALGPSVGVQRVAQQDRDGARQRGRQDDRRREVERPRQAEAEEQGELESHEQDSHRAREDLGLFALHVSRQCHHSPAASRYHCSCLCPLPLT
uniref:Uncharacterized protein n=1 Tax=Zea mays TaxID=4577 RepID=B4FR33_MAIZE|nr:unknown [Zea mays]